MLTPELAERIVRETMERVGRNINMMDTTGHIIASGDASRVGSFHAAAAEAVRARRVVVVNEDDAGQYEGAISGLNMPVYVQGRIVGVIGLSGPPAEVEPFARLLAMATELMIGQNLLRLQDEWRQFTTDWIVEQLVHADAPDPVAIEIRLAALRLTLDAPYRVAVARYALAEIGRASDSVIPRIARELGDGVLVGRHRPNRLALLFVRAETPDLAERLRKLAERLAADGVKLRFGIGNRAECRSLIRVSCEEAELALKFAEEDGADIVAFDGIEARALARLIPAEHRARLRAKLEERRWGDKERETLEHFFRADLSIAGAASSLGIHRNTMIYRLDQIAALTGYDPRNFRQALVLQLALWE